MSADTFQNARGNHLEEVEALKAKAGDIQRDLIRANEDARENEAQQKTVIEGLKSDLLHAESDLLHADVCAEIEAVEGHAPHSLSGRSASISDSEAPPSSPVLSIVAMRGTRHTQRTIDEGTYRSIRRGISSQVMRPQSISTKHVDLKIFCATEKPFLLGVR